MIINFGDKVINSPVPPSPLLTGQLWMGFRTQLNNIWVLLQGLSSWYFGELGKQQNWIEIIG